MKLLKLVFLLLPFNQSFAAQAAELNVQDTIKYALGKNDEGADLEEEQKKLLQQAKHKGATYHNLGFAYNKQGNYEEAIQYYKRALAIHRKVLGCNHKDTATTYHNLGTAYKNLGN